MLRCMTERLRVLLVEADPEEEARFGAWLEADEAEVLACPGPSAPDYTCVGARTRCPLIDGADVVVLDMSLQSEGVLLGTAAEELLGRYLLTGRPVVTLGSRPAPDEPGELVRLPRAPTGRRSSPPCDRSDRVRVRQRSDNAVRLLARLTS